MNLPSQAKKVFTGVIFDVYQWEQEMFDGTKEVFEMIKRPDTVQIIATRGDKILYAKESQPTRLNFSGLIGGRVDPGEKPEQAAIRELKEEAGMEAAQWKLWKSLRPELKIDWEIFFYIGQNCKKVSEQKLDPGEKIEICSASFDDFIALALGDNFWCQDLTLAILKMKNNGTLESFQRAIFS